jgi:hypothetical protein
VAFIAPLTVADADTLAVMRRALPVARSAAALALVVLAACTPQYVREDRTDRRPRELQVVQHAGGTHHVLHAEGTRWIQAFGHRVLAIDVTNGRELGRVDAVEFGTGGSSPTARRSSRSTSPTRPRRRSCARCRPPSSA